MSYHKMVMASNFKDIKKKVFLGVLKFRYFKNFIIDKL